MTAFALARLDDDERFMRVLTAAGERRSASMTGKDMGDGLGLVMELMADPLAHAEIGRWPDGGLMPPTATARLLADVAMKRQLLEIHSPQPLVTQADRASAEDPDGPWRRCTAHDWAMWPCGTVRLVLASWNRHPDYRAEWKP